MFQSLYECSSRSSHLKNGVKEGVLKVTYVAGDTTLWGGRSFDGLCKVYEYEALCTRCAKSRGTGSQPIGSWAFHPSSLT